jgi:hypothetical protein
MYCIYLHRSGYKKKLRILLLPTIFIKSCTALYDVIESIAIDFTFIHCTYILTIFLM